MYLETQLADKAYANYSSGHASHCPFAHAHIGESLCGEINIGADLGQYLTCHGPRNIHAAVG